MANKPRIVSVMPKIKGLMRAVTKSIHIILEQTRRQAREIINRILNESGWKIVNRDNYSPKLSAVAIEEVMLKGNLEADYLLFINGKAIGVLEAKKEECQLSNIVMQQAERYVRRLPSWCSYWYQPLPIVYLSNGKEILFKNINNPNEDYTLLSQIHSPKEIVKILGIEADSLIFNLKP